MYYLQFESFSESSYSDETPLIPNEFLHEPHITAQDLGGEPILGLMLENEPDLWIQWVPGHVKRSLKEKQVSTHFRLEYAANKNFRLRSSSKIHHDHD